MKMITLITGVLIFFFFFCGCTDDELSESAVIIEEGKPTASEVAPSTEMENKNVFISVDGNLFIKLEDAVYADNIPAEVDAYFSTDSGEIGQQGYFFVDTKLELREPGKHFVALFINLFGIDDIYITDPRGFQGESALLITDEGSVEERVIAQFQYLGEPKIVEEIRAIPEGTSGVIVFTYDKEEKPREVHYYYTYRKSIDQEAEKGLIIIPLTCDYL